MRRRRRSADRSGEESLQLAAALAPGLVLMDVDLPDIDGPEATRRLRDSPVVVLLSTYDEDAGERFAADCGSAAYVTKSSFGPDRLEDLWAVVARWRTSTTV